MAIGPRIGPSVGIVAGPAVGVSADTKGGSAMAGVTRDATSLAYFPSTLAEWTTTLAVAGDSTGAPSHVWTLQDASGNAVDAIGADNLVAGGTAATYQSAVAGLSRKGILVADGASSVLASVAADLPDISATSALLIGVIAFGAAPAASREVYCLGSTVSGAELRANGTPRIQVVGGSSTLGASSYINTILPCVLKVDRNANAVLAYTSAEKITTTLGAITGKRTGIGSNAVLCGPMTYVYLAEFVGTAAQKTDAQIKTILRTLGYTILW